jgi:hypothetical protein
MAFKLLNGNAGEGLVGGGRRKALKGQYREIFLPINLDGEAKF